MGMYSDDTNFFFLDMTKEEKKAYVKVIDKSIKHWISNYNEFVQLIKFQEMVDFRNQNMYSSKCALCGYAKAAKDDVYDADSAFGYCKFCIANLCSSDDEYTNNGCQDTPWQDIMNTLIKDRLLCNPSLVKNIYQSILDEIMYLQLCKEYFISEYLEGDGKDSPNFDKGN